jgi:hypothetical protein
LAPNHDKFGFVKLSPDDGFLSTFTGGLPFMKKLLLVVLFLSITSSAFAQNRTHPYELNGDWAGMSLTNFKLNHPLAECQKDFPDKSAICIQWDSVAIFGAIAHVARSKPSQGSVPADLTEPAILAFVFNTRWVRAECCVDPLRPPL